MPELTPQERLQPALLDRLTDDEPGKSHEAPERRVISKSRLRRAVLRDLAWLFNATKPSSLGLGPHVRRSVVSDLPALSTRRLVFDVNELERSIRQAILDFEPRILPETLEVRAIPLPNALDHHNILGVEIAGELWAQPVPLELLVRTEIDLETGRVEIADPAPRAT